MANPLYGQNKQDNYLEGDPGKVKSKTVSVADASGNLGAKGLILPGSAYTDGNTYADPDPYVSGTTQLFPLGSKFVEGRNVYRYCGISSAGAVIAGKLIQQQVGTGADHEAMAPTENTAIGSTSISIETDGTDLVADGYNGGYLWISAGTGIGQSWEIKDTPAHDHSDDPTAVIQLYGKVTVALATGDSKIDMVKNPFADGVVAPAAETGAVIGATTIGMAASSFGWLKINGPLAMLTQGTLVIGNTAFRSGTTAGAVAPGTDNVLYPVGQVMAGPVTQPMVWLNIG